MEGQDGFEKERRPMFISVVASIVVGIRVSTGLEIIMLSHNHCQFIPVFCLKSTYKKCLREE